MDSYKEYLEKKQRRARREHWIDVARELGAVVVWSIMVFLLLIFVAPHMP